MSNIATRLKPADFRRRAFCLVRQCWKLLLIAAILTNLFYWAGQALAHHGESLAHAAYDEHMTAFYAENPRPEDEQAAIEWAYFDEWLAQRDAEERYDAVFLPWKLGGLAIDLLDSMFSAMVLVGLYTGLLMQRRTGEHTLHCLCIGFARWKTAAWLAIRIAVLILSWGMLALIPGVMLVNMLGDVGEILAIFILFWVALWAECRYALAFVHMAEDTDGCFTVSDYIRYAADDMGFFTVRGVLRTAWPAYALMAADFILGVAGRLLPVLTIPSEVFDLFIGIAAPMLLHACYACIFEELASHRSTQVAPGLAHARALAAGEESAANVSLHP